MHRFAIKIVVAVLSFQVFAFAETPFREYSYGAQKAFIHKELGRVYLGMTMTAFAEEIALGKAEVTEMRFDYFEFKVPVNKKAVESIRVRVHGLSKTDKAEMIITENNTDDEDFEVDRIIVGRIPNDAVIYSMYVTFQDRFKFEKYLTKTFGPGEVRKADDENHFFDTQWTKTTSDGLSWLIRAFHLDKKRELQLLGRIPGSEWDNS